jgi:hypothetical protein
MSAAYEFRKIYLDCIEPDGAVTVAYQSWVRLAGAWIARRSVERYGPDGVRAVVDLLRPAVEAWDRAWGVEEGVRVEVVQGAWAPPPPPTGALDWRVAVARGEVALRWPGGAACGRGYADRVRITVPTRLLGLATLVWGRVHLEDRTVVFEHLTTAGGARWDVGFDWRVGETAPRALAGPVTLAADGVGSVSLDDGPLTVAPARVLHQGDAFDPERVPRAMDRWFCRTLGGPTHETRWLGVARHGERTATALYERVIFGAVG